MQGVGRAPESDDLLCIAPAEPVSIAARPSLKDGLQSLDFSSRAPGDAGRLAVFGGLAVTLWTVLAGVRAAIQIWRLEQRLAECAPLRDGCARQMLDRLRRRTGIRHDVLLRRSTKFATPVACGLWTWTIVLPEGCTERLRSDELEALLAHELAHLARRDPLWTTIGHVLTSWLTFQPLNRVALRQWQAAAEYQCDDWAVARIRSPLGEHRPAVKQDTL
ncbi:MAG: M56 family metallopeptidase [Pirellulales bacterium]